MARTLIRCHVPALVFLLLARAAAPAAARLDDRGGAPAAGIDCGELDELEPLLAQGPRKRSHYLGVEEIFHRLLLDWPAAGGEATAAEISDLEQRLVERRSCLAAPNADRWRRRAGGVRVAYLDQLPRPGSGRPGELFLADPAADGNTVSPFICLAVIEGRTLGPVFAGRPDTLLAIARLYQQKHAFQLGQKREAYARRSLLQVETLLAAHLASGETADAEAAATILALAAVDLAARRAIRTTEEAVAALHRALEIDPEHEAALYLAAHYEEKLADYEHARGHLERLEALGLADAEVELRLAVQLARTGESGAARRRLAELPLLDRPEWVAIVAAEELATLLTEAGRAAEAATVLEAALERFPNSSQLKLQLAQTRHADWGRSWPLVDQVLNGWQGDRGEPARVEYERGRPLWIAQRAAALDRRLAEARAAILGAVGALTERSERQKRADAQRPRSLCHGTLPLRRLPDDPGDGPFAPGSPGYDG